jgi:hypothetical protein
MLSNEQVVAIADLIREDHVVDFSGGEVVTDVLLVVRSRDPERLGVSVLTTVSTPETDYVTLVGMLHFATQINEGSG